MLIVIKSFIVSGWETEVLVLPCIASIEDAARSEVADCKLSEESTTPAKENSHEIELQHIYLRTLIFCLGKLH